MMKVQGLFCAFFLCSLALHGQEEKSDDAIQRAIDAAAKTGGLVHLDAGTYLLHKPLRLTDGIRLKGRGPGLTILKQAAPGINLVEIGAARDVNISHMKLVGDLDPDKKLQPLAEDPSKGFQATEEFQREKSEKNGAIRSDDSTDSADPAPARPKRLVISDVVCEHFRGNAIYIKGAGGGRFSSEVTIRSAVVRHCEYRGIVAYYISDLHIENCRLEDMPGEQIVCPRVRNIAIRGCECVSQAALVGINVGDQSDGVTVIGNRVRGAHIGIGVEKSCRQVQVTFNHVSDTTHTAIGISSDAERTVRDVAVNGNIIAQGGGIGIKVCGARDNKLIASGIAVRGNLIQQTLLGIQVANASEFCVASNITTGCEKNGINVMDSNHGTVQGNIVSGNKGHGILVNANRTSAVTGINVCNNICRDNASSDKEEGAGICLKKVSDSSVMCNMSYDRRKPPLQTYGLNVSSDCANLKISANLLWFNRKLGLFVQGAGHSVDGNVE